MVIPDWVGAQHASSEGGGVVQLSLPECRICCTACAADFWQK